VKVRVQALDQESEGRVSRFAGSLDRQTRTMETEIDFDNRAGRLIPGMYTETRLSLREKKNAITIPLEAISRNGDEATVMAINAENIVEERKVRLGVEDSARIEVLSGLSEGERAIIGNRGEYHNGERIQPRDVSGAAAGTGSGS
jgi:RND family efflux transporter MFP subunit